MSAIVDKVDALTLTEIIGGSLAGAAVGTTTAVILVFARFCNLTSSIQP